VLLWSSVHADNSENDVNIEDGSFSWQLRRATGVTPFSPDTMSVTDYGDDEGDLSDSDRNELLRNGTVSRDVTVPPTISTVSADLVTLRNINLTIAKVRGWLL